MQKIWNIKPVPDSALIDKLSDELNIDPILSTLLVQRNIFNYKDAENFFVPNLENLYDPFLMEDMDKAVSRIYKAIENKEQILIYGDYDVDGTTSVALVFSFLQKIYDKLDYYIPERYSEGYGISFKGIDYAQNTEAKLIIALDCGIKAIEKVEYASKKGIDFIICDHHLPGDTLPDALAILNPKKVTCSYPFKELSGCGVGFKMLQAYCIKYNLPLEMAYEYLDMVAVSIASDIVPIIDENRILAHFGLIKLNSNPGVGLKAIRESAKVETSQELNINDIVFKIGPRINAAGRIDKGIIAVDLLIATEEKDAADKASKINICNDERKELDKDIFDQAKNMIELDSDEKNKRATILYHPEWHKGVVGIVASRLIEYRYKPTIVFTLSNGFITGSARSVEGFDLYRAIDSCSDLLENYGGHMFAAGITLRPENFEAFKTRFQKYVSDNITPEQLIPRLDIDAQLPLSSIDAKFFKVLQRFQPFGPGNMTPIFSSNDVFDSGYGRTVGKNNEHLKLDIKHPSIPKTIFPSIAFQMGYMANDIAQYKHFDICYSLEKNEFMGQTTLQLRIRDIRTQK